MTVPRWPFLLLGLSLVGLFFMVSLAPPSLGSEAVWSITTHHGVERKDFASAALLLVGLAAVVRLWCRPRADDE